MGILRLNSKGSFHSNESLHDEQSWASDRVPLLSQSKSNYYSDNSEEHRRGITLSWKNLTVFVPAPRDSGFFRRKSPSKQFKKVINNVSGIVEPGTLMAVMGASGAGKTTLMNALAWRHQGNTVVNGDIRVNGIPIGKFMKTIAGYVFQEDLFVGSLTVKEHLNFMAHMKLDRRLSKWERQRRVEELLVELGLKKCEHTRIGVPGQIQGISGGERKRLAFASEAISGCPLLFADECTTGLDSFSAQRIVAIMKNSAAKGKTIMCTIHQPSSQVFGMFDQLCLLAEGRIAFLGKSEDAMSFLAEQGYRCPENYNPADFYIRALAINPNMADLSREQISTICDTFENSSTFKEIESKISEETSKAHCFNSITSSKSSDSFSDQTLLGVHVRKPLWLSTLFWLFWRASVDSFRNPKVHTIRTVQKIVLATLIGSCFYGIELNQLGIQNIQGAIFMFLTENTYPNLYGVLHSFPYELPLVLRENRSGLYGAESYYLAKIISQFPGFVIEPIAFISIAYWMIGLRATWSAFLTTTIFCILVANVSAACGCFFSLAFSSLDMATTCLMPFDYILMVTGGLFINLMSLPSYLSWSKFLSWFMYANEAISIAQWKDISNITCDADPELPCVTSGNSVLETLSFDDKEISYDYIGIIGLYVLFHFFSYLALVRRCRAK